MPKSSGRYLGRKAARSAIIAGVGGYATHVELSIEIDSDPITGSVAVGDAMPQEFCGWIELVAAIESARNAAPDRGKKRLGSIPGANGRRV